MLLQVHYTHYSGENGLSELLQSSYKLALRWLKRTLRANTSLLRALRWLTTLQASTSLLYALRSSKRTLQTSAVLVRDFADKTDSPWFDKVSRTFAVVKTDSPSF